MKKRLISLFLICLLVGFLFGFSSNKTFKHVNLSSYLSNEAHLQGIENPIENQYEVKDLSGNTFFVKIGEKEGFMVFDPISYTFTEKSATFISPYDFSTKSDYYYFGPLNYFERKGNLFYALGNEKKIVGLDYAREMQSIFDSQLVVSREQKNLDAKNYIESSLTKDLIMPTAMTKKYIDNYQYIRDSKHPDNYDDSCGFVAASLVLYYWHKTVHNGLVLPSYLDSNGELNDTYYKSPSTNLKDKLVEFNGGNTSSWGKTVRDSMIDYATYANTWATSSYYFGKIGLDNELVNNRPVIIFGSLPNHPNSNLVNHAVTAYGTETDWWGGYYIVNYGWKGTSTEVSLGFGFVGSVTTFRLDKNNHLSSHVIKPNDYGYPGQYATTELNKTVTKGNLSFDTKRLRTGFIENEYIVLSPRRENYDTAYLEYKFENPVYKIEVDLAFWSNDERYGGLNVAEARFEYKNLHGDSWNTKLNLLSANLPTDRNNPTRYVFEFPAGTREFRFYTHFDVMISPTDRNKGRICIGDMIIYTESNV